jgi:hypothetical protein
MNPRHWPRFLMIDTRQLRSLAGLLSFLGEIRRDTAQI